MFGCFFFFWVKLRRVATRAVGLGMEVGRKVGRRRGQRQTEQYGRVGPMTQCGTKADDGRDGRRWEELVGQRNGKEGPESCSA